MTSRVTDHEWLLGVLADRLDHSLAELLARSMEERGCGLTVHSRVAQLRDEGHVIVHQRIAGAERGHAHVYRLVGSLPAPGAAEPQQPTPGAGSEAPSAQSGPETDGGRPDPIQGSSVAGRDLRISREHMADGSGPDCGDGQLSLIASPSRGAYDQERAA